MTAKTQALLQTALDLPPDEHAELIDELYHSLESETDEAMDALWAQEAEARVRALDAGLMDTVSADEVFKGLER